MAMERTKGGLLVPASTPRQGEAEGGLILPEHVKRSRKQQGGKRKQKKQASKPQPVQRVCCQCSQPDPDQRVWLIDTSDKAHPRQVLAWAHKATCLGRLQASWGTNRTQRRAGGMRGFGKYSQHKRVGLRAITAEQRRDRGKQKAAA